MEDKYPVAGDIEFDVNHGGVSRIYNGKDWINIHSTSMWDSTQPTKATSGSGLAGSTVTFRKGSQFNQHANTMYYPNPPKPSAVTSATSAASAYHGDHPITYTAFERLFWDTLVDLGWKAFDIKPDGKIEQIMLTCPECGKSIGKTQMVHTITKSKAHKISSPRQIEDIIRDHKKTTKGCDKPEYDENGDLIN